MTKNNSYEEIYVALLDEGVNVWRPVKAERLANNVYCIIEQPYDSEIEKWKFEPGEKVVCEYVSSDEGRILVARLRYEEVT